MPTEAEIQGASGASGDTKVELSKEQQDHVNKIFDQRFGKITAKHEQEVARLAAELETAKAVKDAAAVEAEKNKGEDDPEKKQFKGLLEAEKNKAKLAEAEMTKARNEAKEARNEAQRVRKEVAITKAANKQNFFELDVVSKMIWDTVEFDEDAKTFVIKEGGAVRQNSSLVPMTLDEYLADFAAQRPYLVNGSVKGGTSSTDAGSSSNSMGLIKTKKDLKTAKEKSEYITKFGGQKFEDLPLS